LTFRSWRKQFLNLARPLTIYVWRVGKEAYSCAFTVVTHDAAITPAGIRQRLALHEEIVHSSTIEIHRYPDIGVNGDKFAT
jgi:hypothetical protein